MATFEKRFGPFRDAFTVFGLKKRDLRRQLDSRQSDRPSMGLFPVAIFFALALGVVGGVYLSRSLSRILCQ
jgi:hypothetical protein